MTDQKMHSNMDAHIESIYLASLSFLQATSPLLNYRVVNTKHNHANDLYCCVGDTVKYDLYDCTNFPVQIRNWVNFIFEVNRFETSLSVSDFMEASGIKNIQRFSEEIEKTIVKQANKIIPWRIDLESSLPFISNVQSSIIASPNFIDDNIGFFKEFFSADNQYNQENSWHAFGNEHLNVYTSEALSDEQAILFHDKAFMVSLPKMPCMYPFSSAQSMDQVSGVGFRLAAGSEFGRNFRGYSYDCNVGCGAFPGKVLKVTSKKYRKRLGLEKNESK